MENVFLTHGWESVYGVSGHMVCVRVSVFVLPSTIACVPFNFQSVRIVVCMFSISSVSDGEG